MDVRVLVVEDEQLLADAIAAGLRHHALAVDVVYDGAAALERATVNDYDVIVLDRDLPAGVRRRRLHRIGRVGQRHADPDAHGRDRSGRTGRRPGVRRGRHVHQSRLRRDADLGAEAVSYRTIQRHLAKVNTGGYRDVIAGKCFAHAADRGGLSLLLYDVTTLYFEAEDEDDLRKVGYSKERRIDPQIVVGLLVDRTGFPLEVGCFEGNTAETTTLAPIITAFGQRHDLRETPMVIAADAGMLSAANLTALDEAELGFIVGSRSTKAPGDLESHFHWNGDVFTDGQIIDTITPRHANSIVNDITRRAEPVWNPDEHADAWRAIWAYSAKRARRDQRRSTPKRPAPERSSTANVKPSPPGSSRPALGTACSTRPVWPARNRWSDSRATSPTSPRRSCLPAR